MSPPSGTHEGILELHPKGYGFLRSRKHSYTAQNGDPYVPSRSSRSTACARATWSRARWRASAQRRARALTTSRRSRDSPPEKFPRRNFDDLTPIDPHEHIRLETGAEPLTTRVMDLLTPIGKGQRGLIVAPPRTGKTILLQHIAQAVTKNHPEMHLIMLLIDERPEEVTDMRRTVQGEVIASSSDRDSGSHIRIAELVVERAKRLAEQGKQVFVLLDSLTRLARAYNKNVGNGGRTMSGGVDIRAMEVPKTAVRHRPRLRGGRLADGAGHRPDRHRLAHGRGDLSGVQGHRQHGAGARPQARRPPHLPRHRHRRLRHAQGRADCCRRGRSSRSRCCAAA